ncbi:MAG: hypothetical protein AAGH92_09340 [Planctomycetota bacterium]
MTCVITAWPTDAPSAGPTALPQTQPETPMKTPTLHRRHVKPTLAITAAASMIGTGLMLARPAAADENPFEEIPFELRVDMAKAYASPVGQTIMDYVREAKPNADELMNGLTDTLGLDPRTAVSNLVLRGAGINEYDIQLIADLGETTGKLEGWMLGLPGYESFEIDEQTLLHSFLMEEEYDEDEEEEEFEELEMELERLQEAVEELEEEFEDAEGDEREELEMELRELKEERDELREELGEWFEEMEDEDRDDFFGEGREEEEEEDFDDEDFDEDEYDEEEVTRVFVAMPESNGQYTLIATLDGDITTEMAQAVLTGETLLDTSEALKGDQVLRLTLDSLEGHTMPHGAPGSAVLESITGLSMTLGSGERISADVFMGTSSPARARQVTQLLQGLVALSQLAALEQPEMQELANLLADVQIQQFASNESPGVSASFSGSHEEFEGWIRWIVDNAD